MGFERNFYKIMAILSTLSEIPENEKLVGKSYPSWDLIPGQVGPNEEVGIKCDTREEAQREFRRADPGAYTRIAALEIKYTYLRNGKEVSETRTAFFPIAPRDDFGFRS